MFFILPEFVVFCKVACACQCANGHSAASMCFVHVQCSLVHAFSWSHRHQSDSHGTFCLSPRTCTTAPDRMPTTNSQDDTNFMGHLLFLGACDRLWLTSRYVGIRTCTFQTQEETRVVSCCQWCWVPVHETCCQGPPSCSCPYAHVRLRMCSHTHTRTRLMYTCKLVFFW
jgi:hypothetical protein